MKDGPFNILVHLDWRHGMARDIFAGIMRYAVTRQDWNVTIGGNLPPANEAAPWRQTGFDGIVSGYGSIGDLREVRSRRTRAIVFFAGNEREKRLPGMADIRADDAAAGRLAAEFFLKRGFTSFGFVETPRVAEWAMARGRGLPEAAGVLRRGGADIPLPGPVQGHA